MRDWFRRPRAVFTSWIIYWICLFIVGLGPAAAAIWSATRGPDDHKSSVNVSFGDGVFSVRVIKEGLDTYASSIHLLTAALWIAVPPLAIWLLWVVTSGRRERAVRV
jgi:hypothetical protein